MKNEFDLIVIGSGSGASGAARKCRKAGWKVAVADERPFGGTCALRGCDMKKVLAAPTEAIDFGRRMQGHGVQASMRVNWPELMAFKRSFINGYSERFEKRLADDGIQTFRGRARFVSDDTIETDGQILKGAHILIAAGARPADLGIAGEAHVATSDEFLEMDELPENIVFIGGGMISMEFAHIAVRAGSCVTVIEAAGRTLHNFDADLVALLAGKSEEAGIRILYDTKVQALIPKNDGYTVLCDRKGERLSIDTDMAVHGAGRVPNIQKLALEAGGIDFGKNGVTVSGYMQSVSNKKVYAAGDAAGTPSPKLTPVAGMESHAAGENLLHGNRIKPDYSAVATVLFTLPRLASVGMTAGQAREAGFEVTEKKTDMSSWYTYKRTNEGYAMAKIVLQKGTGKILGAHLAGGEADELINHFAAAIARGESARDMLKTTFAYPTAASDIEYML